MDDDDASPPWTGPHKDRAEQTSFKTDPDELPTPHAFTPQGRHESAALYVIRFGRFRGRAIASIAETSEGRDWLQWAECECDPRRFAETIRKIHDFLMFADTYQAPGKPPGAEPTVADGFVVDIDEKNSPPRASRPSRPRTRRGRSGQSGEMPGNRKTRRSRKSAERLAAPEDERQPSHPRITPFVDEWQFKEAAKHKLGLPAHRGRKIGHVNTLQGGYAWLVWVFENTIVTSRNREDIEMIGWFLRRSRDDLRIEKAGNR